MSNSGSAKQLNYPQPKKITNRNPVFRSTTNFTQHASVLRPFSRKPNIQADQSFLNSSKIIENDLDISAMQKSLLEVQSVMSGGGSMRQTKFQRTNKNWFLSPKSRSKNKDQQRSFSPQTSYGTQSMILKVGTNQIKRSIKDCIRQKQSVLSESSQKQQDEYYLQKSISSNNLFRRNTKTRNIILSKFSQLGRKSKDKPEKSKLDTSIHVAVHYNEKEERKKFERMNTELKYKNAEKEKQCENLCQQNSVLVKENTAIKNQVTQLKKKIQQFESAGGSNSSIPQKTPSQTNLHSYYQSTSQRTRPSIPLPTNENKKCQKCEQKQKSNQKQVTYFENIIKKKETQLVTLRRKQSVLTKQNSQLFQSLEQTRHKFNELLEHQKIASQNEQKLQECVNELKDEVARLKDELRYLHIENLVLLKIKNENLKLKIDITKIQDERDYFKMKIMQIHKKNGNVQIGHCRNSSQKFIREKTDSNTKKSTLIHKSKKFYFDSTETQQIDCFNIGIDRKHHSRTKNTPLGCETPRQMQIKNSKHKLSEDETNLSSSYADALFDLTSEENLYKTGIHQENRTKRIIYD